MEEFLKEFIKPELLVLVPVLYLVGAAMKKSKMKNEYIPITLGAIGIILSMLYVGATCQYPSWRDVLLALFTGLTQGVLCAGASVYVNQLAKQQAKNAAQKQKDGESGENA